MFVLTVIVSIVLALMVLGSGGATIAKVPAVADNVIAVGWPEDRLWVLGGLKILGGIGLLVGLAVAWIGVLAAVGLVLYFIGALLFHARAKNYAVAPAVVFLVLSILALVFRSASA